MRAVIQRVSRAEVRVDGHRVGGIGRGLCALVGVDKSDTERDAELLARKVAGLRVFEDEDGKMNRDVSAAGGSVLAVSQFTLLGDMRKGRRPSFADAMDPDPARTLFERFCRGCVEAGLAVETGRFRAHMEVELVGDGPVTILLDTHKRF